MKIEERKSTWIVELEKPLIFGKPSIAKNFLDRGIDVVLMNSRPVEVVFRKANYPSENKVKNWMKAHMIEEEINTKILAMGNKRNSSYLFQNTV